MTPKHMIGIDYADKAWLQERDYYVADNSAIPVTRCDRCAIFIGAVFVIAPTIIFWADRWLP